jgi:aminoglycoside 3-N-acetyltransferase
MTGADRHSRRQRLQLAQREAAVIDKSAGLPVTVATITQGLERGGVGAGDVLEVHSSMASMGWVCGGEQAVIEALMALVTVDGTITMPAHSTQLSDPATWRRPKIPGAWVDRVRAELPAWDRALTPTRWMGRVAEMFRLLPGVVRSDHPHSSLAAWGRHAADICARHPLTQSLGDESPMARLYDLDAKVVLIGVGQENNTALHLSESRATWLGKSDFRAGAPMMVEGRREWVEFDDLEFDSSDFAEVGRAFDQQTRLIRHTRIGTAPVQVMPMRALVDFGVTWMEANRPWLQTGHDGHE